MKDALILTILMASLTGCASMDIPRMGEESYTVYDDEIRLQKRSDEICKKIDESRFLYSDTQLDQYLAAVTQRLLNSQKENSAIKISIKTIQNPSVNALSFCNGRIYLFTGLLAVMDNEAQIATIIAHEISHIVKRDTLREFRSNINKTAFFSSLQTPALFAGGGMGVSLTDVFTLSSISGYSKLIEKEADVYGFKMVQAAGYDLNEPAKAFEKMDEYSSLERAENEGPFSSHPRIDSRIQDYKKLAQECMVSGGHRQDVNEQLYKKITYEIALDDVSKCLYSRMYKTADKIIEKLAADNPSNVRVYFLMGELYRKRQDLPADEAKRDKNKDYFKAVEAYNRALMFDPVCADCLKGKGLALQKRGELADAKSVLTRYLEVCPQAQDKSYIENILKNN